MSEERFDEDEDADKKSKSKGVAFALWFFTGLIGGHKFYLGKIGMGIAYMFTVGFCGIGWIMDIFTLFAQVDVANGIRSPEETGSLAGLNKLLSISRKMQSIDSTLRVDESELVTCKYCGQKHRNVRVFTSSHFKCDCSPTGRHVPK
jgi:TM2 domain-containing membrane protein YozV